MGSRAARASARLLERDQELRELAALVGEAAGGEARVVVVEGAAGIGKTQLLAAARLHAAEAGLRVLTARGGELEREFAFGIVRQLFEPVLADAAARARALAGAAGAAATVFETVEVDARPRSDSSFAVLHGLYWLAVNLSGETPLALVVDDLHWCDRPSLRFLAYLARRLEGLAVVVLASLRPAEPGVDTELLAELLSDPVTVPVRPRPLTTAAVAELVRERLGEEPEAAFSAACHDATGGNPLLLNELLKVFASESVRPVADHIARVRELGPRAASRAVLLRLARLQSDAVAVARAVAVLGDGPRLADVVALAGLDEERTSRAIADLVRAEIMRSEPPLGFVHPLVAGAVHADLPPGTRELQHRRAAALLATAGGSAEHVAAQLLAVPASGDEWAVPTLRRAAAQALRKGAPDSAVAYLARALGEPQAADDPSLLLELGLAEALTNGPAATRHLREAWERLAEPRQRADAAQHLVRALLFTGDADASAAVARSAAAELPDDLDDLRLAFSAAERATLLFGGGESKLAPDLEPFRDAAADGLGAKMLAALAAIEWAYSGGPAGPCSDLALRAHAGGGLIAADNGGVFAIAATIVLVAAERSEAAEIWELARSDAYRRGSLFAAGAIHLWHGYTLLRQGELADAQDELEAAADELEGWGYGSLAVVYVRAFLAQTILERGDVTAARSVLDRGGEPDRRADGARFWLEARVELLLAEGRPAEALALCEETAAAFPRVVGSAFSARRVHQAVALDRLGRTDEALAVAGDELELARRWGAPGTVGRALRVLGTIERDRGLDRLREAVTVLEGSRARLERARALAALGTALRLARRPTEAREPLRRALEVADVSGAAGLADEVRSELYATGARPRASARGGVTALTASELRVASLAAEGQTNREIAQALFVTPKTVEVHLSSAYRKLGIASRRALPRALAAAS